MSTRKSRSKEAGKEPAREPAKDGKESGGSDRPSGRRPAKSASGPHSRPFASIERELDQILLDHLLVASLGRFLSAGLPYPFVDMRELKPGAAGAGLPEQEVVLHHHGLVMLIDGLLPPECRKHIRVKDKGKAIKENIAATPGLAEALDGFELSWTIGGRPQFEDLLTKLMWVDYGIVVQNDPRATRHRRFALTHFRVRVDWPVEDAAEALARELRYVDRHLYEDPESPDLRAEQLEAKLYERFGFHHTVGGRRTAAVTGAQYLRRLVQRKKIEDFRVYIGSAEARTVTKIAPRLVTRYALIRLTREEIDAIDCVPNARATHIIHHDTNQGGVGMLQVTYVRTEHARRGKEKKGLDHLASLPFLKIGRQVLIPRRECRDSPPIPHAVVYRSQD